MRWRTLVAAVVLVLPSAAVPRVAADVIRAGGSADGRGDVVVGACGAPDPVPAVAVVSWTGGGEGFAPGATLQLVASPANGTAAGTGIVVAPTTLTLPADWGPSSPEQLASLDVAVPAGTADGSYAFTVTATGADGEGRTVALEDGVSIVVDCDPPPPNSPPRITAVDRTVEGDVAGGALLTLEGVVADDAEDGDGLAPPTCTPAVGAVLPVGSTTVSCTVTDSGGLSASASFSIVVVDTTPPALAAVDPVTTHATDADGAVVTYVVPTATDVVDVDPVVACDAVPGSRFRPGVTTVTCTAVDDAGATSVTTFTVQVRFDVRHVGPLGPDRRVVMDAGDVAPFEWRIEDGTGDRIRDLRVVTGIGSEATACTPDLPEQPLRRAGSTRDLLLYRHGLDRYAFNWRSSRADGGTCRLVTVELADGIVRHAEVRLR